MGGFNPVVSGLTQAFGIADRIKSIALRQAQQEQLERDAEARQARFESEQTLEGAKFSARLRALGARPAGGVAQADAQIEQIPDPKDPTKTIPNPRFGRITTNPITGEKFIIPSDEEAFAKEIKEEERKADIFLKRFTAQQEAQQKRQLAVGAAKAKETRDTEKVRQENREAQEELRQENREDLESLRQKNRQAIESRREKLKGKTGGEPAGQSANAKASEAARLAKENSDLEQEVIDMEAQLSRAQEAGLGTASTVSLKLQAKRKRMSNNRKRINLLRGGKAKGEISDSELDDIAAAVRSR